MLTGHVVAIAILLDLRFAARAPLRDALNSVDARLILIFKLLPSLCFLSPPLVVLLASFTFVESYVVDGAYTKPARSAAEDVALNAAVVDLTGRASRGQTKPEVGNIAECASRGELVETDNYQYHGSFAFRVETARKLTGCIAPLPLGPSSCRGIAAESTPPRGRRSDPNLRY